MRDMIDFVISVFGWYEDNEVLVYFMLIFMLILAIFWLWHSKFFLKLRIKESCKENSLSMKRVKKYIDKSTKSISEKESWTNPSVEIKKIKGVGISRIILKVPKGVKKSDVDNFRETLESLTGVLLLPPEQNHKNPNHYVFKRASVDSENF